LVIETITGRGSGKSVEEAIKSAKRRIYIVSPYISSEYAKLLLRKAINGVEVFVVTLKGKREFSTALLLLYSGKVSKNDVERVKNYRKRLIKTIHISVAIYIILVASVITSLFVFGDKNWVYLLSIPLIVLVCSVFFYAGFVEYAIMAALIPVVFLLVFDCNFYCHDASSSFQNILYSHILWYNPRTRSSQKVGKCQVL